MNYPIDEFEVNSALCNPSLFLVKLVKCWAREAYRVLRAQEVREDV